jgi:hypothetical protein
MTDGSAAVDALGSHGEAFRAVTDQAAASRNRFVQALCTRTSAYAIGADTHIQPPRRSNGSETKLRHNLVFCGTPSAAGICRSGGR